MKVEILEDRGLQDCLEGTGLCQGSRSFSKRSFRVDAGFSSASRDFSAWCTPKLKIKGQTRQSVAEFVGKP